MDFFSLLQLFCLDFCAFVKWNETSVQNDLLTGGNRFSTGVNKICTDENKFLTFL